MFGSLAEKQAYLTIHAMRDQSIISEIDTPLPCMEKGCFLSAKTIDLLYTDEGYWLLLANCQHHGKSLFTSEKEKQRYLREYADNELTATIDASLPCHVRECLHPAQRVLLHYNLVDEAWETLAICLECREKLGKIYLP